jgi:hypothetical protein
MATIEILPFKNLMRFLLNDKDRAGCCRATRPGFDSPQHYFLSDAMSIRMPDRDVCDRPATANEKGVPEVWDASSKLKVRLGEARCS